jgi:transposase-like protein
MSETEEEILSIDASLLPVPLLSAQNIVRMYDPDYTISETAKAIGVDRAQLSRWMQNGLLLHEAERLAQKIGLHPSYVWGPEYHIAVYMAEIVSTLRYQQKLVRQKNRRRIKSADKKLQKVSTTASGK